MTYKTNSLLKRDYSEKDVEKLRGSFNIEYSICKKLSKKLWELLKSESYVNT